MQGTDPSLTPTLAAFVLCSYFVGKTLTTGHIMRLTSKGQVTIPQNIRELAGLAPGSEVEFEFHQGRVWIEKVESDQTRRRQKISTALGAVAGSATNSKLRTDEILRMTRGEE